MKRLILLNCLLFFVSFYTFNSAHTTKNVILEAKTLPLVGPSSEFLIKPYYSQEGFCGNTLVQTLFGYKPIKKLIQGDVVIDCNGEKKEIIAISKHYANRYIKLIVDDMLIHTGYDQLYYKFPGVWISAHDIKVGDILFNAVNQNCLVASAELIYENELLYCLTVEDHIFCIAPDNLCVHNAQALVVGVASVCLGHITIINPIIATIGATIALSLVAHKAYQTYIQQDLSDDQAIVLPAEVILAERLYYIQRCADLEVIKRELLHIKKDLENIKVFCYPDSLSFTYQFLKQTNTEIVHHQNQLLKISAAHEKQLSANQKDNLRTLREIELNNLEKEIIALQTTLALHIDELIEQMHVACQEYQQAQEQISTVITLWNNNYSNMKYAIALQLYKTEFLEEHLLNNCNQKINELKIVSQYYISCEGIACIKQSTNVFQILEKLAPVITEYDQWVVTQKIRVAKNIDIVERHFTCQGISVPHLKNAIKNELAKDRNDRNARAIAEAKNKLASIAVSGGFNKPPKKDDDGHDESNKDSSSEKNIFKTTKEATEAAEKLGFEKTNYRSQGQPVFKKGNRYISPDIDSHNGGVWKMADSVKSLGSRVTRMGTYDAYLNRIGD